MIILLVFILPFLYLPGVFNPYEFPKFIAFVAGVEILILRKGSTFAQSLRRPVDMLTLLVAAFLLLTFVADLLGLDPKVSLLGSTWRYQGFLTLLTGTLLFFLTRFSFSSSKTPFNLHHSSFIMLTTVFLCLFALWQAFAYHVLRDPTIPTLQGRIIGTMGNPNVLAGYLAMLLPFLFWGAQRLIIRLIPIGMSLTVIFFTQSRAGIIAAGIAVVVWLVWLLYSRRIVSGTSLKWIALGTSGILLLFLFLQIKTLFGNPITSDTLSLEQQAKNCLFLLPENDMGRALFSLYERYPILLTRASFCEGRLPIWSYGLLAVSQQPFIGIGQENFELIFSPDRGIKVDNAHNIFLEVAVSSGLIGLFLFVAIVAVAIKNATLPVRFSLLAFLVVGSFNPLSIAQIALFWYLLAAATKKSGKPSTH